MPRKASAVAPAAYSPTDHPESRAINCLNDLLKHPSIKSHIVHRDKTPNVDGFVELVDDQAVPIGKIEVQVKYLNSADRRRMAYSCKLPFLSYCNQAPLPVLLIAVAPDEREAFWTEITRAYAKKLIGAARGRASATVRFSPKKMIDDVAHRYVGSWRRIAIAHRNKLELYDRLAPQVASLRAVAASIEQPGLGFPDPHNFDFSKIQTHLDELNLLLETSFPIVREALFPGAWKIGFAFADYQDDSLAYCYYPVGKGKNDLLIRRVSPETFRNLNLGRDINFHENPIVSDPIGSAREYVQKQSIELLDDLAFRFDDIILGREMLFTVADKLNNQLGILPNLRYLDLEKFKLAWDTYLPNWIHYARRSISKATMKNLLSVAGLSGFVDLGALEFAIHSMEGKKHSTVATAVREQIIKGRAVRVPFPIGVSDLPLGHVSSVTTNLMRGGATRLERLYTPFNFNRRPGLISNWWTLRQFVKNLKLFYREIPRLFSHVVEKNFPGLQNELTYFNDFNRRIIVIDDRDGSKGFHYRFCDLHGGNSNRIDIHSLSEGVALPGVRQRSVRIDGIQYEVRRTGGTKGLFMFHSLPLLNELKDELKDRIPRLSVLHRTRREPNSSLKPGSVLSITLPPRV